MPAPTSRTLPGTQGSGAATPEEPAAPSPGPRTATLPRWLAACVIGTGLAVLVLASTGDAVPLLDAPDSPALGRPPGSLGLPSVTPSATATGSATATSVPQPFDVPWLRSLVLGALIVAGVLMLAGTLVAVAVVAKRLWEDRWQRPEVQHALGDERVSVDLAASREALQTAAAQMREALRTGSPRNAVVRCWLLLVDSLEGHGVKPHPAQSATEFTRFALTQVSADQRAVAELTALFLEARFSQHELGERARERAVAALDRIVTSLDSTTSPDSTTSLDSPPPTDVVAGRGGAS